MIQPELVDYRTTGGRTLRLHVWRPPSGGGTVAGAPMLLDLHGGAWTHFTPAVDRFWCRRLAEAGFLVASAEVRLSGEAPYPACADDARAAAVWLRTHGGELGGDTARLGVLGGSTGGHLALLVALEPAPGGEVDGVIALWPVADVPARYAMVRDASFSPRADRVADRLVARRIAAEAAARPGSDPTAARLAGLDHLRERRPLLGDLIGWGMQRVAATVGHVPPLRAALYRELASAHEAAFGVDDGGRADEPTMRSASPVHLLAGRGSAAPAPPPLLVVQGRDDPNISVGASEQLVAGWRTAGGHAELVVQRNVGHSFGNVPSREAQRLVDRMIAAASSWLVSRDVEQAASM